MTPMKTQRIALRATARQEALIQQAASETDRSVSEFILSSATEMAERVLTERRWFTLSDADFDAVLELIDAPMTDTSRFERLWQRPSPFGTTVDVKDA